MKRALTDTLLLIPSDDVVATVLQVVGTSARGHLYAQESQLVGCLRANTPGHYRVHRKSTAQLRAIVDAELAPATKILIGAPFAEIVTPGACYFVAKQADFRYFERSVVQQIGPLERLLCLDGDARRLAIAIEAFFRYASTARNAAGGASSCSA